MSEPLYFLGGTLREEAKEKLNHILFPVTVHEFYM